MQQGPTAHLSASGIRNKPECSKDRQHSRVHCRPTAHLSAGVQLQEQLQERICRRVSGGYLQGDICRGVSAGGYLQAGLACSAGAQVHLPQSAGCHNCCSMQLQQPEHWLGRWRGGIPGAVHPHLCIRPHRLCGTFNCLRAVHALHPLAAASCTLHPRPRTPTLTLAPCLAIHWESCAH